MVWLYLSFKKRKVMVIGTIERLVEHRGVTLGRPYGWILSY